MEAVLFCAEKHLADSISARCAFLRLRRVVQTGQVLALIELQLALELRAGLEFRLRIGVRVEFLCALDELNGVDRDVRAVIADLLKVVHDVEEVNAGLQPPSPRRSI